MLAIEIPGRKSFSVSHLVLDYNGTIAVDGALCEEIKERLQELKNAVEIHVLTADTYGSVHQQCSPLGIDVKTFPREGASVCKKEIVESLEGGSVCVGNGYNDIAMFDVAELSVAVMGEEGMCAELLSHTDVFVRSIKDALDLLLKPNRLKATLRT